MKRIVSIYLVGWVVSFFLGIYFCPQGVVYLGKNGVLSHSAFLDVDIDQRYAEDFEISWNYIAYSGTRDWETFAFRVTQLFGYRGDKSAQDWFERTKDGGAAHHAQRSCTKEIRG